MSTAAVRTSVAVDWDLAADLAPRAVRPGPEATRADRTALVAALRAAAPVAAEHVARITRLTPPGDAVVRVVDRPGWARANVAALRGLAAAGGASAPTGLLAGARGRAHAVELAGVLGLLSGSVLGQYDPWGEHGGAAVPPRGTLLLVAPTVLAVERTLEVDPQDFRLWVALHEQTHAQQFAAAPWLAGHLARRSVALLGGPEASAGSGARAGRGRADRADRGGRAGAGDDRRPQELLDEVGAVMALLEGHADVTMDQVGRAVLPSVRQLRRRFGSRRDAGARATGLRRAVRAVLGLDVKLAQYRDGAAFVRAVRRSVGTAGLNAVWSGPDLLPTATEIADPPAWVRRVHG
ncbi:MAG TPA: zinc-dependent metalloprotease [Cellulomonas sp.]